MQMDIDQQCSQIIAKRQPAAVDLRMILTVVKIVNDLERVGDEVKKIAYKAQQMQQPERLTTVRVHVITPRSRGWRRRTCASRSTLSPASTSTPRRRW